MSTAVPLANSSIKRAIKKAIQNSGMYVPFLPLFKTLFNLASLSEALAWCRSQSRLLPGGGRDSTSMNDRCQLYEFLMTRYGLDETIDYLEFGVYMGASIKWWLKHNVSAESRFYGFDTFTGLPEDWGSVRRGYFTTNGRQPLTGDTRVCFIKGLFQETLDDFLGCYRNDRPKVIHIDADLYSSTLFVLTRLGRILRRDDIVIFDEFLSWKNATDEFRAFRDFVSSYQVDCRLVGAADLFSHVAVRIL
jgi:O-methyltransferase